MEITDYLDIIRDLNWGAKLFVGVTITLLVRFVAMRILNTLAKHLTKTKNAWDDALFEAAKSPLSWFILIIGLLLSIEASGGSVEGGIFSPTNLALVRQLTLIVLIVMFLVRFVNLAEVRLLENLKAGDNSTQTKLDPTTLQALAKLIRLSVFISAVLITLPTIGIEITALLAFGGVGGIAVGFAAQDLLSNFFGGLMIYLDRPFDIGDWIRSPDREIEGTVESIGWRLTVVRTFDKRPLYVPNSVFNTLALENPSRMTNRRIKETIGIRYQDSAKMGAIVNDVKSMLKNHEEIDSTQTLIVNFNSYAASSLDFFIYTFTKTTNWIRFHEIKQDVMLKIIEIVHSHDADFAFPTTTLDGIDGLLGRAEAVSPE
ncbi:MAG: mechanosensitive ion channel protein MscS [SAR86 cluster bacterium]|uniref:Mechanosensitive ion channel protein MscS n=1 Tax=SAR86 cluster bacterium TaxID=2030880 RepID=A0A2A5AJB5_9GAMM|nr:MAG: mechanosensitive ion channel protein MscS [SAR86 cluster bacterium]